MRCLSYLLLAVALVLAALAPAPEAALARRAKGDALTSDARAIRKAFKRAGRNADRTFGDAMALTQRNLATGAIDAQAAALQFGNGLAFYAATLKNAADDASADFAQAAASAMNNSGDADLDGAVAGDGGSYDAFAEALNDDLGALRRRALKRSARFRRAIARDGGARVEMRVRLEQWTVSPQPVPQLGGAFTAWDEPLRMWGVVMTRLTDGRVVFSVFGSADADRDEQFDVRLQGSVVRPLGDLLADGGMDVEVGGTWSESGTLGNPFEGDGVEVGPRQVYFGVEPEDQGLAGIQPTRREHATAISIP